jgi:hypothetical protein
MCGEQEACVAIVLRSHVLMGKREREKFPSVV